MSFQRWEGDTISSSQITGLYGQFACPAKFYWDKVEKMIRKPAANMDIGKAVERVITHYHLSGGEIHCNLFIETIDALRTNTYPDRFGIPKKGYPDLSPEEKAEYDEAIAEVNIEAMMGVYTANVRPLKVIEAQLEVVYEIFPGVRIYIYPDLVTEEAGLIELKTAGRKWSDYDIAKKSQHIVQAMGVEHELGFRPPVAYHVLTHAKTPSLQVIPFEVTDEEIEQTLNLIRMAVAEKRTFSFVPHARDKTKCSVCGADHTKDYFFPPSLF